MHEGFVPTAALISLTSCFQRAMLVCLMLCMSVPAFWLFYAMHAWGSHHGETESEIFNGFLNAVELYGGSSKTAGR